MRWKNIILFSIIFACLNIGFKGETRDCGWEWLRPLPQGNDLNGVWISSPTDVHMVGDLGTIMHYDAVDFSMMESGVKADIMGIWGESLTNIYEVTGTEQPGTKEKIIRELELLVASR